MRLPFGELPGAGFMGLATTDTLTHAWDLAKATGQNTDLAPEPAERLLAGARTTISDAVRATSRCPSARNSRAPKGPRPRTGSPPSSAARSDAAATGATSLAAQHRG